ncbi:alkaline phosphatase [Arachidicoccus ginsenosidimutans]|uniref:DedA family protein n=1 Tax=Arachidicoccus sp. BS20 TaxID=1850526 RepID=UPI0007F0A657|nr:VTT domain-containing protein [Arachidicoccus sp. BS20]ANI88113.1 alkaline phosphatase [Arachidicoccus sp. BS20]
MQTIDAVLISFDWKQLLNPDFYVHLPASAWIIAFIIFAETGLFIGFFLPGDSLLFVAGIFSEDLIRSSAIDTGNTHLNLFELIIIIFIAGVLGNMVGYWFGKKSGPLLFHKKDTWYFKQKHLVQAHNFFEERGGGAIIFARFLPIVRTFAPIVAGIVEMDRKKFMLYNIIGSFTWTALMLAGGHYLDRFIRKKYGFELTEHLEVIVIGLVVITTAPIIIKMIRGNKKNKN